MRYKVASINKLAVITEIRINNKKMTEEETNEYWKAVDKKTNSILEVFKELVIGKLNPFNVLWTRE